MDRSERNRESVTVDDAIRRILTGCVALVARSVLLLEARDLVLAENIFASSDSPRFDTVAMDGYAVQEADIRGATQDRPVKLGVVGSLLAGSPQDLAVAPGTAVRVMTGAEVPTDADVVIPFEEVESGEGLIVVRQSQATGTNIRRKGEDIAAGTLLLEPGVVLSPAHLALIASEGIAAVDVRPRPRVSVIATGDELIAPGEALAPGQIWDSNSVMVAALISQFGGDVTLCTRTRDEAGEALALIRKAVADGSDLIVTIGGASRGDRDVLSEIAADGISLDYWDVRMKPGRPLAFGSVDGIPVMGLPGNPAAAFVSAIQFVRPAILTMNGRLDIEPPVIEARVTEQIANPGGKRAFYRVTLARDDSGPVARPAGRQNVANLATLARADGLLVIPESMSTVDPGTRLPVQVIRDL